MSTPIYTIGLDFGTVSARAILIDTADGHLVAEAESPYTHGVVEGTLPDGCTRLPASWALQVPQDYLDSMEACVSAVMKQTQIDPAQVKGIACDFTASTVFPVDGEGTPLCSKEKYRQIPQSYAMLWKHHGAEEQARRAEELAKTWPVDLLSKYGGKVSSEWFLPKAMQLLEEAPDAAADTEYLLEGADWIPYQLTGHLYRSTCCAGFKRFWSPATGDLPAVFLSQLNPDLPAWLTKVWRGELRPVWESAGGLTHKWANRLGLLPGIAVGIGNIDAHSAILGGGITDADQALLILGTSACHMILDKKDCPVPGICGSVADAVMPGYYVYEAGQTCVGDVLAWFVKNNVPEGYTVEARHRGLSVHQLLTEKAAALQPGQSGLLALDWWNGQRTPYVDFNLTGLMMGMTLQTKPEEQYRALLESLAYGTRLIFDTFAQHDLCPKEIVVCGGIAGKNPLMMQIFADVLNRPFRIAASTQGSALGAAILAAVAGGVYDSVPAAVTAMTTPGETIYSPRAKEAAAYDELYQLYHELGLHFAKANDMMKHLLALRDGAQQS